MKSSAFSERQYETNFHIELGSGGAGPFVPSQSMEWHVGIDAATNARDAHRIWRILNVHIPRRMPLSPAIWPHLPCRFHEQISGRLVSLFFQFKVPKYHDSKRSKYRVQFDAPYYSVAITQHQQRRLVELQRRVQSRALVRYASPAFWTRTDFDRYAGKRQILEQSAYIVPSRIKDHKKWMYAGPSGKVILNPDPELIDPESWALLIDSMSQMAQEESLREHVARIARSIRESDESPIDPEAAWLSAVREYAQLSPDDVTALLDLRTVADAAEQADTSWVVMISPDDRSRKLLQMLRREFEAFWPYYWF